jgi:amidase
MNLYRRLADEYETALSSVDVLITPTTPYVADRHGSPRAGPSDQLGKSRGVAINTVCFNASGHPAMNLPVGFLPPDDDKGRESGVLLPVGMQIVGKMLDEAMIYRVGAAWEANYNWRDL